MSESSLGESVLPGALPTSSRARFRKVCAWLLGACALFGTGYAGLHSSQLPHAIPIDLGAWPSRSEPNPNDHLDAGAGPPVASAVPPSATGPPIADRLDAGASAEIGSDAGGRLGLNRATASDFDRLPGIGAKRAEAIIELRSRLGRFRRVEDLLRVRGIGRSTLKRLRPLIEVD